MSYNLPKKKETIEVTPEDYPGLTLTFRTIGPEEAFELMEEVGLTLNDIQQGDTSFEFKPSAAVPMLRLARERITGAEPLTIDEEPFDPDDPEHVASLSVDMLMEGVSALLSYPFLGNGAGKDSKEPAGPSPKGSTRSAPSPTANAGSS